MQTNLSINTPQSRPAFGAINYASGAKDTLKAVLNSKQLKEFTEIVNTQKRNDLVDIVLFGNGKKLSANVADSTYKVNLQDSKCTSHSQRFFESPLSFVKRMCEKVEKRTEQVKEIITKNELLK